MADNMGYNTKNPVQGRYQLRKAAGRYWFLDMEQPGSPYKPPVVINECGAFIWQCCEKGLSGESIAGLLSDEYGIPEEEALQDVLQFLNQLNINR